MNATAIAGHSIRRLDAPLLRPEQAAELLAVKTSWVYEAVRIGPAAMPSHRQAHSFHPSDA
jgi:hypothetical protein